MLAATFEGEGKLKLKNIPVPKIKEPDDVLIKVNACSICGTDVHILKVPPAHPANKGAVLGHEYTGEVVGVGKKVFHLKKGDMVVVDPNLTCGYCSYCKTGLPNMCDKIVSYGIHINGGFSEYSLVKSKSIHKISKDVPGYIGCLCEPISCILNGINKVKDTLAKNVLILGAGPIGLLFTLIYKQKGTGKVIVAEVNKKRANVVKRLGADIVINPKKINLKKFVKDETEIGADLVIDAAGHLLSECIKLIKRGGEILLFGMNENARCDIKQYDITRYEFKIIGTYIANATFPEAVRLLESKRLNFKNIITHKVPLSKIHQGIELARTGEAIKVVVIP
jgi:threonine dehydrogenase-like Zn-dependent dehydrogenase